MAAGLATSPRVMSLLVQRPVDTRGSADDQEDVSMETRVAETLQGPRIVKHMLSVFTSKKRFHFPCMDATISFAFL